MRFIGILGLVTILGIGFLFSKNKRAIKPRTILWGVFLQILFAIIILGESFLSWIGLFVFVLMILIHIFEDKLVSTSAKMLIGKSLLLTLIALVLAAAAYGIGSLGLAVFLMAGIAVIYAAAIALKKPHVKRILFALFLLGALGTIYAHGLTGRDMFRILADKVDAFLKLADLGSIFLFGNLAKPEFFDQFGFQFAFSVLPTIIFFSAVMSILYYLGIMQALVQIMARFMRWTMGTSGAETLSCSANIFVGQTEAPLLIKPFLPDMTKSELHAIMVGGFATIAGGVLAGYIRLGVDAGHLIAASVMSAPAALVLAKLFYPETETSKTSGDVQMPEMKRADNLLDAATRGVTDGLKLAVNVGAMLIAFIALIGLVDVILSFLDKTIDFQILGGTLNPANQEYRGIFPGSLETFFGTLFSPLAFLMGVPWDEAMDVGNLLGIKIAVNEFVAYAELANHIQAGDLSERSLTIATYALCGFANFASIGIQLGGIGALAPERRSDLSKIALKAMFAGAFASWTTATIAGILL